MIVSRGTNQEHLYQIINARKTQTQLPQPLHMGQTSSGQYSTAPLKRYTSAFCQALADIIAESAKTSSFTPAEHDDYLTVFHDLKEAYLASADDIDDGADFHGFNPQK